MRRLKKIASFLPLPAKGAFTNYVSIFFVFFDPLPPSLAIVSIWLTPPKNYVRFWAPPPKKKIHKVQ